MKINFLFCLMLFTQYGFNQAPEIEWQKNYGGSYDDVGHTISGTMAGGFILGGDAQSNNIDVTGHHGLSTSSDYWLVNTDEAGSINWQKSYGGSLQDVSTQIFQTADGGFITCGYSESINGNVSDNIGWFDYWVVKMNIAGNIEWKKNLGGTGGDFAFDIDQTSDLGYIISGYSYSIDGDITSTHGAADYWVVKLDALGNLEWEKTYGGSSFDYGLSIIESQEGGYLMTGYSLSNDGDVSGNHGDYDTWIIKIDDFGALEWEKSYGGTNYEFAANVIQNSDGDYIVCNSTLSNNGDVSGNHAPNTFHDYWVFKINQTGTLIWQKCYGGTRGDYCQNIIETSDKGYILTGYAASLDGDVTGHHGVIYGNDYWVVKINAFGALEWQKSLGGSLNDNSLDVNLTSDGGILVFGSSESNDGDITDPHGNYDYWLVKLQCSGNYFYADNDADGFGNSDISVAACFAPSGFISDSTDCNDANALINPGVLEFCNLFDDNCNGLIDDGIIFNYYYTDADGDGYGDPLTENYSCNPIPGAVLNNYDCNDTDALINPAAPELCNILDDNCNGAIDEGIIFIYYYTDADLDGYGDPLTGIFSCNAIDDAVLNNSDCNDTDATINPDAIEICNMMDDNCNALIDDGILFELFFNDADNDGFGNNLDDSLACALPVGYVLNNSDCNDSDVNINPDAIEICNALDDNCNLEIDEGLPIEIYYVDADGDLYGNILVDSLWCLPIDGYVLDNTDCNDADPLINPGIEEILNGIDDNCNQLIDEGLVGVNENEFPIIVSIYPNPANDNLFIKLNASLNNVNLEIIDMYGNKVFNFNALNNSDLISIDISNLPQGVYVLHIENDLVNEAFQFIHQ